MNAWASILFILKCLGIFITGAAGFASALTEDQGKKFENWILQLAKKLFNGDGRGAQAFASKVSALLIKKESCVRLVILGIVVALISQSVETWNAAREEKESRDRTESQLRTAQQSLDYLERLSTRFDSFAIEIKFELNRDSKVFSALYDFADHFLDSIDTTNSSAPTAAAEGRVGFFIKTNLPDNRLVFTYAELPAKFYNVNVSSNTSVKVSIFFSGGGKEINYKPTKNDGLLLLCSHFSTNSINNQALQFIQKPVFDLGLCSVKTKSVDFSVEEVTNTVMPIFITYAKTTKKLYVDYALTCPKTNWNQTKWMTSLPDLAGATFMISASDVPNAGLQPIEGNLTVDNMTTISLTNFTRILTFPDSSQFSCVLPDKQQILQIK